MFKPRQRSPPRSNRGPARKSRYHRSFIRCRKKSSCVSHTSLYCGVQAPAFFRFRSSESKHASSHARMTAPRLSLYHRANLSICLFCTIATSALLNLERLTARGRRGTRLSAGEICTAMSYSNKVSRPRKSSVEKGGAVQRTRALHPKVLTCVYQNITWTYAIVVTVCTCLHSDTASQQPLYSHLSHLAHPSTSFFVRFLTLPTHDLTGQTHSRS